MALLWASSKRPKLKPAPSQATSAMEEHSKSAPLVIREYPVPEDALRQPRDVSLGVIAVYGDEHQQPAPNFADGVAGHDDAGATDTLQKADHLSAISTFFGCSGLLLMHQRVTKAIAALA